MIQMSLVQIDNYGPWTVDPAPKREADIQILQSSFYADVQHQFSSRDGLAFATRFDNILAISNGIDKEAHLRIQQSLHARYPFTLSIGVGAGRTALEAQEEATRHIHKAGSAQSSRTAVVEGSFLDSGQVDIGHFDIDDATGTITDVLSAYDAYLAVKRAYLTLAQGLRELGATAFFVGGDNVIAPINGVDKKDICALLNRLKEHEDVPLKVGFGTGSNAHEADLAAKHELEHIRSLNGAARVAASCRHQV